MIDCSSKGVKIIAGSDNIPDMGLQIKYDNSMLLEKDFDDLTSMSQL